MKRAAANRVTVSHFHRFLRFSPTETSRVVRHVLSGEGASGWSVGVAFVSDDRMKKVNARHLGRRGTTDVLSFVYEQGGSNEGEIVVCLDQARRQAPRFRGTYTEEVVRLLVHGSLHLLGFNDERPGERATMKIQEDHYVEKLYARADR